jgi:aminoglycoside phosphotransferase (APT) family kinase protein
MNEADASDQALEPSLTSWILSVTGGTSLRAERRQGGASRAGYAVDVEHRDGTVEELWLRLDTGYGPQSSTLYTVRREGAVYGALRDSPVRVARLRAIHPTRDAFLAERLVGRNWFAEIRDPAEQVSTARAFMQQLAALHAIDVHELILPELGSPTCVSDHVREELAIWQQQYVEGDVVEPVIALAFCWLAENLPDDGDWPVVLVQGDTGPGNFMYADGDVVAVMDWEMAHWGDLHDDFGWLCVRDVQERFTALPERIADYEQFGGRHVDLDRLRYFRVLAQLRCAVGTRRGLLARDSRGEIANHLIFSTLHLRLLADALAEAMGLASFDLDGYLSAAGDPQSGSTWLFDVALADLRDVVVPALPKGFAQQRAKGLARLVKFLRSTERLGAAIAAEEHGDLSGLLAAEVGDLMSARSELCARIEAGTIEHRAVAEYCQRQGARTTLLARDAMGALATRRYAPID